MLKDKILCAVLGSKFLNNRNYVLRFGHKNISFKRGLIFAARFGKIFT
ncbi:hypothetical protein [Borreliella valaisiana]|uniref:Uncharacterized protein n=1 Tax=Borreliella valaisiana VS116 TaxID=445987 RepID=D6RWY5_BORVA|nr:hypothetical protein [Borreliella valaisiana]EEF82073.1 conserved hypothetical protein [Borreliella valaisiana VS116]